VRLGGFAPDPETAGVSSELFLSDAFDAVGDGDDTFVMVVTVVTVEEALGGTVGGGGMTVVMIIGEIDPPPLEPVEGTGEEAGRQSVRTSQLVQSKLMA
jgi:hypothetical protein